MTGFQAPATLTRVAGFCNQWGLDLTRDCSHACAYCHFQKYGYDEHPPAPPPPPKVTKPPARYTITITVSPRMAEVPADKANLAVVMAYVPENALVWFNDEPTRQRGILREYESPPLEAGKKYTYHVRIVWFEDGHWVSPVFLCCEDCAEKARKDPNKTLAKLKELKAKSAGTPRK